MNEIEFNIEQVIGRLSAKIANLEAQLAISQALNEELKKRLEKTEKEKAD